MNATSEDILEQLGPARRFADPNSPLDARLMAAGGALPMPPPQLVSVVFALTLDPDPAVKERAAQTLRALPERVLEPALVGKIPSAALALFAELFKDTAARLEKIALNPATSDETYCFLASLPHTRIVEITAQNQVRLLRCPALVETLGENPLTSMATIDRILHFLGVERGAQEEPEPERGAEVAPLPPPPSDADPAAVPPDLEDPSDVPKELLEDAQPPASDAEKDERAKNIQARIGSMSIMEKVKLARLGNGDARAILVRDRNKLVAAAAIRNPKLTDSEVESFARSRNVCDEVIRIIANNRAWTRGYPVKLGLTMNPRCPASTAIKFLNYLTDRDLGTIMRSRDVPGPIVAQAKRIMGRKGKT